MVGDISTTDLKNGNQRIKATAGLIVDEYILCNSAADAAAAIDELHAPEDVLSELVKHMLLSTLDKAEKERTLLSALLSSLCVRGALEASDVEAGLELVLKRIEDLALDVPKVVDYFSHIMAHLIEDKAIPESFLDSVPLLAGSTVGPQILSAVKGLLTLPLQVTLLKTKAKSAIQEYFVSGDIPEVLQRLDEMHSARYGHLVVKLVLVEATEKKNREREMASVLLSALTKVYGSEHFFEGFIRVLRRVDDLALDTPMIVSVMTNFIARAIVDDVLPPCFFSLVPAKLVMAGRGKEISLGVRALLEQQGSNRIMNQWGPGAKQTMEELKASVKTLVDEYLVSGDTVEGVKCVQELGAPHYGHQVVKTLIYRAVERGESDVRKAISFIKALVSSDTIDHIQDLPDLVLDVPDAGPRLQMVADLLAFEQLASPAFEMAVQIKAKKKTASTLTDDNVQVTAETLVQEFLDSDNARDIGATLDEFQASDALLAQLVKHMVLSILDKPEKEQGVLCGLLSSLCVRGALQGSHIEAGLEGVLKRLEDLVIDVPKAVDYAAHIIAHLIEDKTVPESLLDTVPLLAGASLGPQVVSAVKGLLTLPLQVTVLKGKAKSAIQEYFVSGDIPEALRRLGDELHAARCGQMVVKLVLVEAAEKKNREREMASVLLSALTGVYGSEHFFEGFIRVLRSVDDLALDTPGIVSIMTNFIARAIVDDVLPPCFLSLVPAKLVMSGRGKEIAAGVRALLEQQGSNRIMNVWGSGAKQTMEELKESVKTLVDEYLVSGDVEEALRCVQELGAPHYGHQVVKTVIYRAVERGEEDVRKGIALILALIDKDVLDQVQVQKGISRALLGLPDLSFDVPAARPRLDTMVSLSVEKGILPPAFMTHLEAMAQS